MPKKRKHHHQVIREQDCNPVLTKIPILQKIIAFAGHRIRFPLIAASVTSTWRETVVEHQTGLICWSKQLNLLRRAKDKSRLTVAGPREGQVDQIDDKMGGIEFIHKYPHEGSFFYTLFCMQLQELFNRAVYGGSSRWPDPPVDSSLWVVEQMIPLCGISSTDKNISQEQFFRFIGGQEDGAPIDVNFHVNVPKFYDWDEFYEKNEGFMDKWKAMDESEDFPRHTFAKDDDFLPDKNLLKKARRKTDTSNNDLDEEEDLNSTITSDDDEQEDLTNNIDDDDDDDPNTYTSAKSSNLRRPQTKYGFAPLFWIAAVNSDWKMMELLGSTGKIDGEHCFCTGNGLTVFNFLCGQEGLTLGMAKSPLDQVLDLAKDKNKLLNAKDRTGLFPLLQVTRSSSSHSDYGTVKPFLDKYHHNPPKTNANNNSINNTTAVVSSSSSSSPTAATAAVATVPKTTIDIDQQIGKVPKYLADSDASSQYYSNRLNFNDGSSALLAAVQLGIFHAADALLAASPDPVFSATKVRDVKKMNAVDHVKAISSSRSMAQMAGIFLQHGINIDDY